MSWRDIVARREQRREREDRNLPPRMRQGSPSANTLSIMLWVVGLIAMLCMIIVSTWRGGDFTAFWILMGSVVLAALFAYRLARTYRSKSRKELRGEPEADSVRWEDPER